MTQSICRELEKRTVVHTMLSKFMHKSTSSLKLLNKKYDWYGSYSGTILCTATTVASIYVLMPPKLKIFSRRQTMSVSTAQGQKITRQKNSHSSSPLQGRRHHQFPNSMLTSQGLQTTIVLTGQCFGALAKRYPSSLPSHQCGSHMSWVKQKKILNCLLFLSAATRK